MSPTSTCEYKWDQIKTLKGLALLLITIQTISMNEPSKPHSNTVRVGAIISIL